MKKKKTPVQPYTEKQLAYFQAIQDQEEGFEPNTTWEDVENETVDGDYVDYLLGHGGNAYDGTQMDTEFEDLGDESDWFMD